MEYALVIINGLLGVGALFILARIMDKMHKNHSAAEFGLCNLIDSLTTRLMARDAREAALAEAIRYEAKRSMPGGADVVSPFETEMTPKARELMGKQKAQTMEDILTEETTLMPSSDEESSIIRNETGEILEPV